MCFGAAFHHGRPEVQKPAKLKVRCYLDGEGACEVTGFGSVL